MKICKCDTRILLMYTDNIYHANRMRIFNNLPLRIHNIRPHLLCVVVTFEEPPFLDPRQLVQFLQCSLLRTLLLELKLK